VTAKPVILRQRAERDISEAVEHYGVEAGDAVALHLIDELERVLTRMGTHPGAGSPRYAHDLGLPGLRFQLLRRYPYLVFYVEQDTVVDVWRVLHSHRDIPAWLSDGPG
jgi:toxin ParE1/3/4